MKHLWEISKVSTPEDIFAEITEKMPQPVGIVVFGADHDFKNEVIEQLQDNLPDTTVFYSTEALKQVRDELPDPNIFRKYSSALVLNFRLRSIVVFVMETEDAPRAILRKTLASDMKACGAKTVIGIYAKVRQTTIRQYCFTSENPYFERAETFKELTNNPPTAEGLDYLLTVEREREW